MAKLDENKIEEYNEILKLYNQKLVLDGRIKLYNTRTQEVIARWWRQNVVQPILNYHETTWR